VLFEICNQLHYLITSESESKTITGSKRITYLPFDRNDGLVNREGIFEDLDKLIGTQSRNRSLAIWGLGGCGLV